MMGNQVYANKMEISCKAADGKSICAFPDVCFTPPENPATPPGVPIPYPNTGLASDTTDGSSTVKISGQEVMLKNKSYFKKSMGDEAGCASKKGVITSKNMGKVYFKSWSMDVKVEGENVVRHLDITTHNHASEVGQTPPQAHLDSMAAAQPPECDELKSKRASVKRKMPESRKSKATVAVGMIKGPGRSISIKPAASSVRVGRRYNGKYSQFAKGIKKGGASNIQTCDKPSERFAYRRGQGRPKQAHAEAKLIEDFFRDGGDNLIISVSNKPCNDCMRLIYEVNKGKSGNGRCNKILICMNESWSES